MIHQCKYNLAQHFDDLVYINTLLIIIILKSKLTQYIYLFRAYLKPIEHVQIQSNQIYNEHVNNILTQPTQTNLFDELSLLQNKLNAHEQKRLTSRQTRNDLSLKLLNKTDTEKANKQKEVLNEVRDRFGWVHAAVVTVGLVLVVVAGQKA
ncbi:Hypothetical_protein [Hexamita inflata]|uniref:Hypothetical_protein n=1 Tax=Hexamita inflata TaxID=28002 RepID=A0AA86QCJ6_9EUKA|nr:Hypothetical protein HINF_LOCUS44404 [Hexamita inflata]